MKIPERIWASGWDRDPTGHWWHDTELRGHPEYIRRHPTVLAELPEVRESISAHTEAAVKLALERAASVAQNACLVPPDGGSPTPEEEAVCRAAADYIRALDPAQFIGDKK